LECGSLLPLFLAPEPKEIFEIGMEDPEQMKPFLQGEAREIAVPQSGKKIMYDPLQRIGVGISQLGTSEAVAIGAYAFALNELDKKE
jgi:glucokinase